MDEAHVYERRIQRGASRLYHEHERRVLRVFSSLYTALYVVKFFRGGHHRRGQIWAFVLFVWNLQHIWTLLPQPQRTKRALFSFFFAQSDGQRDTSLHKPVILKLFSTLRSFLVPVFWIVFNLPSRFDDTLQVL